MLLAALVAHFIEINFGIAIVATRMLFWIYVGLLIVVGYILPLHSSNEVSQAKPPVQEMVREDKRQGNR